MSVNEGILLPRPYRTYTQAERLTILATAVAEALSATDVQRRFGVKPITYYSWRRKSGLKSSHGRRSDSATARPNRMTATVMDVEVA